MTTLILFFTAIAATAYALGRVHEQLVADIHADDRALDERLRRPVVTVTDAGWSDTLLDDGPGGRHGFGRAHGTPAQQARWAANTAEWDIVRPLFTGPQLEAVDA